MSPRWFEDFLGLGNVDADLFRLRPVGEDGRTVMMMMP